jgi:hypothetical protein
LKVVVDDFIVEPLVGRGLMGVKASNDSFGDRDVEFGRNNSRIMWRVVGLLNL